MLDARKGRTHSGYEIIDYTLSDVGEVEKLWRKMREVLDADPDTAGRDFSDSDYSFVRFRKVNSELHLLVGTTEPDTTTIGRRKSDLEDYSSEEALELMGREISRYGEPVESPHGLIGVEVSGLLDSVLLEVYSSFLSSGKDFNMDLGEIVHMSWKPCFVGDKFCLMPMCTPCSSLDGWDYKAVSGVAVKLF